MIITDDWAFVHIPRSGGMTFKHSFLSSGKPRRQVEPLAVLTEMGVYHSHHAVFSLWEHFVDGQEVFGIVRNPYNRIVSLWRHYNDMCSRHGFDVNLPDEMNKSINTAIDFKAYLTGELSGWSVATTQKEFLRSNTRAVKIYKFELELEKVYKDYDLQMFPAINASVSKDTPLDDPSNLGLVNEIFAEDFDEFGYEMKRV